MGEVTQVWRQGIYGNSLHFPLNFAMNLKLLFKKKKVTWNLILDSLSVE